MINMELPVLNRRFASEPEFIGSGVYKLLPFRFHRLDDGRYFISNLVGEFLIISNKNLQDLVEHRLSPGSSLFYELQSQHFLMTEKSSVALDLLAAKYASRQSHLAEFTSLHMFVVTLRCDHSCPYCQVSRANLGEGEYDMSEATADRAVELMFRSPSQNLKVEFQGGESLLGFKIIKRIVEATLARNVEEQRDIEFVVATNLSPLDDAMLRYFEEHQVKISTSLDGPRDLHNRNRPRPERDSYERTIAGIAKCRKALGSDSVSALMTTTRASLAEPEAIIDEYVKQGFQSIFIRWLSPYGFARQSEGVIGYPVSEWLDFYRRSLRHIISLNESGVPIREELAAIVVKKMLTSDPVSYVDLQSPTGLGISAVVYNYDGDVYASDESRMLAESGDKTFCLGNVHSDRYEQIFASEKLQHILLETMTDCNPRCAQCAFEPYCGTDPVYHHAIQGDMVGFRATSSFCQRNMSLFTYFVQLLESDEVAGKILTRWAFE